jgi:hypothetical protein
MLLWKHTVTCKEGFFVTYKTAFGLDDWIYWHLIHTTRGYKQLQRYRYSTHFTVHRYTRIRFSVFTSRILATGL